MGKIINRTEQLAVPVEGGDGEMIFKVRGLGAADFAEFLEAAKDKRAADVMRIVLRGGVAAIVSGITDADGGEVDLAKIDLGDALTLKEANVVVEKVLALSRLGEDEKKG